MIAVSSFRPLKDCSPSILRNQLRARESWEHNFDHIYYFGPHETALDGDKVTFIPSEPFPMIRSMATVCCEAGGWCAIVNADIVVKEMPAIQQEISALFGVAMMSQRYEFEGENFKDARKVDNGLDFFAALPSVWKLAATTIPLQYRIGHCVWDTWLMGFMALHYFDWLWDITPRRAVFHPKHEDRRSIFEIDQRIGQDHLARVRWPVNRLNP